VNSCQAHWDKLREAIETRGLKPLVSETGEEVARKTVEQVNTGEVTIDNFDPLMGAYWAIASNGLQYISDCGGSPLFLMQDWDQLEEKPPFERCTICYLNWLCDEHDKICKDPTCQKPKGEAAYFDWMIERAADDQVAKWKELKL